MPKYDFTIIIPAWNEEEFIEPLFLNLSIRSRELAMPEPMPLIPVYICLSMPIRL